MKTALFVLFLSSLLLSPTVGSLHDLHGEPIRNGGSYYIVSAIWGVGGGGVRLAKTGNETCPLTVVQSPNVLDYGMPVTISSPARIAYIHPGLSVSLAFTSVPDCATSSQWTVLDEQGLKPVKIAGYNNTLPGWFKIEKHGFAFKLVFYPLSGVAGGNVGRHTGDDGYRHLVVSDKDDNVFMVGFIKAGSSAA